MGTGAVKFQIDRTVHGEVPSLSKPFHAKQRVTKQFNNKAI